MTVPSFISPLVAALAGCLIGAVLVTTVTTETTAASDASRSDSPKAERQGPSRPVVKPFFPRGTTRSVIEAEPDVAEAQVAVTDDAPPQLTPEPEEVQARWRDALDEHEYSPRDAAWANEMEEHYENAFSAIETDRFSFDRVECRDSTCLASLMFPSFSEATASFEELLRHDFEDGCGIYITFPEPADEDARYAGQVLFQC